MMIYTCFTMIHLLVFGIYVATSPLCTDLCRGRTVGRFSPYEEASAEAVEGGVYKLTRGRVTWG